jgi:hypothetical protein
MEFKYVSKAVWGSLSQTIKRRISGNPKLVSS